MQTHRRMTGPPHQPALAPHPFSISDISGNWQFIEDVFQSEQIMRIWQTEFITPDGPGP